MTKIDNVFNDLKDGDVPSYYWNKVDDEVVIVTNLKNTGNIRVYLNGNLIANK